MRDQHFRQLRTLELGQVIQLSVTTIVHLTSDTSLMSHSSLLIGQLEAIKPSDWSKPASDNLCV